MNTKILIILAIVVLLKILIVKEGFNEAQNQLDLLDENNFTPFKNYLVKGFKKRFQDHKRNRKFKGSVKKCISDPNCKGFIRRYGGGKRETYMLTDNNNPNFTGILDRDFRYSTFIKNKNLKDFSGTNYVTQEE